MARGDKKRKKSHFKKNPQFGLGSRKITKDDVGETCNTVQMS